LPLKLVPLHFWQTSWSSMRCARMVRSCHRRLLRQSHLAYGGVCPPEEGACPRRRQSVPESRWGPRGTQRPCLRSARERGSSLTTLPALHFYGGALRNTGACLVLRLGCRAAISIITPHRIAIGDFGDADAPHRFAASNHDHLHTGLQPAPNTAVEQYLLAPRGWSETVCLRNGVVQDGAHRFEGRRCAPPPAPAYHRPPL
jgi:hypothetical protein